MFLGEMSLKCMQRTVVYPSYIIIDGFNEEPETLKIQSDTVRRYLDMYRTYKLFNKEDWGKTWWEQHRQGRFRRVPKQYCSTIVGVSVSTGKNEFKTFDTLNDLNNLFIDLAGIKSALDTEAVLKFAGKYGLPLREPWLWAYAYQNMDIAMTKLYDLEKELKSYKECYELFLAYKENDYENLRSLFENNESVGTTKTDKHVPSLTEEEIKLETQKLIIKKVNSRPIRYKIAIGVEGPYTEVKFRDLFDVAYFQMGKSLFNDTALGICLNCGNYFAKVHGNMKYCPPPPYRAGKQSSCQNNHQVKARRAKIRGNLEKIRGEFI